MKFHNRDSSIEYFIEVNKVNSPQHHKSNLSSAEPSHNPPSAPDRAPSDIRPNPFAKVPTEKKKREKASQTRRLSDEGETEHETRLVRIEKRTMSDFAL